MADVNTFANFATLFITGGMLLWMLKNQFDFARQISRLSGQINILLEIFKKFEDMTEAKFIAKACHRRLDELKNDLHSQH